jgi:hypothetical protein
MAIFNSYVSHYQRVFLLKSQKIQFNCSPKVGLDCPMSASNIFEHLRTVTSYHAVDLTEWDIPKADFTDSTHGLWWWFHMISFMAPFHICFLLDPWWSRSHFRDLRILRCWDLRILRPFGSTEHVNEESVPSWTTRRGPKLPHCETTRTAKSQLKMGQHLKTWMNICFFFLSIVNICK